jgi:TolA-binding protein
MAIHFANQLGTKVTKDGLVSMADYYLGELIKLHQYNEQQGQLKLGEINVNKNSEKAELENSIAQLNNQINELKQIVTQKSNELESIDARFSLQISTIQDKLNVNTLAKDDVLAKLQEVKSGILQYIND